MHARVQAGDIGFEVAIAATVLPYISLRKLEKRRLKNARRMLEFGKCRVKSRSDSESVTLHLQKRSIRFTTIPSGLSHILVVL